MSQLSSASAKPLSALLGKKANPRPGLESLFLPRTIAVIGATERPGTVGRSVTANLIQSNFPKKIFVVSPKHEQVLGIRTHRHIADIPEPIDLALVMTPAQTVPQIIGDCVDAGVKSAVVISAGFREQGPAGAALEEQIQNSPAPRTPAAARAQLHGIHESRRSISTPPSRRPFREKAVWLS